MSRKGRNLPASIKQRLLDRARAEGRSFISVLTMYAGECFLRRLEVSRYAERFVLKGGLLLLVWRCPAARPTIDVDFLADVPNEPQALAAIVAEICQTEVPDDGMYFDFSNLKAQSIVEQANYPGVRVTFAACLGKARVKMQIDVAFEDVVVPGVETRELPSVLPNCRSPRIRVYPPESTISEKLHAMVSLGLVNSRMKDFYDLWLLARSLSFDGRDLAKAIGATFARRKTRIPDDLPALIDSLAADPQKQSQWAGFLKRNNLKDAPADFPSLLAQIGTFLIPVTTACAKDRPFHRQWNPPGPWKER